MGAVIIGNLPMAESGNAKFIDIGKRFANAIFAMEIISAGYV